MEPLGYLHNKMDVKVLVLFILSRIDSPLRLEDLYEVAYQDGDQIRTEVQNIVKTYHPANV